MGGVAAAIAPRLFFRSTLPDHSTSSKTYDGCPVYSGLFYDGCPVYSFIPVYSGELSVSFLETCPT